MTFILSSAPVVQAQEAGDKPEELLQKCAWIAGVWSGEALGGQFEETWNRLSGSSMMGMFKLVWEGKVALYELLTIVAKDDSLVLRLKHLDGSLKGWEEKDESQEFLFNCKRAQRGANKPNERDGKDGEDGGEGEDREDGADRQDAKSESR